MIIGYGLLGFASIASLLGHGFLTVMILIIGYVVAKIFINHNDVFSFSHWSWIAKAAIVAILIHFAVTAFLITEVFITIDRGEGFFEALLAHYLIDHIVEFTIGVWLLYKTIKGVIYMSKQKPIGNKVVQEVAVTKK